MSIESMKGMQKCKHIQVWKYLINDKVMIIDRSLNVSNGGDNNVERSFKLFHFLDSSLQGRCLQQIVPSCQIANRVH